MFVAEEYVKRRISFDEVTMRTVSQETNGVRRSVHVRSWRVNGNADRVPPSGIATANIKSFFNDGAKQYIECKCVYLDINCMTI